jgi:PilZ domain
MTAVEAQQEDPSSVSDRRRHQRVRANLLGRCMFADRREFPCQLTNISPAGAAVMSPHVGEVGERVIAYVDHVGRLEGTITRHVEGGFAMSINASLRKRDKLADTLTWLANRHVLNLPEERRHIRRSPKNADTSLILPDGSAHPCQVIDMSLSGAAIATDQRPPLGSRVFLGKLGGRVVRHFEDGIALEFMRIMSEMAIEKTIEKQFF